MTIEMYEGPADGMVCEVKPESNPILIPFQTGLQSATYAVYQRHADRGYWTQEYWTEQLIECET